MNSRVSIIKCASYEQELVCAKVKEAVDALGGIAGFIQPRSRVLVKPNLLIPIEPESGVTTHPQVLRGVIRVLKSIDCQIFVGDGPCALKDIPEKVEEVYERCGVTLVCREEGVELVKFENKRWREKFPLTTWLDNCDYVVNLPKFKTHNLTLLTCSIKNLFGLVWGTHKIELHKKYFDANDFAKMLVDIYAEVKPALTIVDGIVAMEGDGPATSGKLRQQGLIVAGADAVALDSVLAVIMGLAPTDILTTKEAFKRGLGQADMKSIIIEGEKLQDAITKPFILPSASSFKAKLKDMLPKFVLDVLMKLIKFYPYADRIKCIRCGACIKGCPNGVISMKPKGLAFDYTKCISCFCCQEFCPVAAIKVGKGWFVKLVGL